MSIINTMLQDLDKRHGRAGGEARPGDPVRSTGSRSPWHVGRNTVLALAGLVMATLAGAWWLQQRSHEVKASIVVPAPPPPVLANSTPPPASPAAPAAPATPAAKAPAVAVPAKALVPTAAPAPMAAASAASLPAPIDAPPPKAVAMSPRGAAGKTYSPSQVSANLLGEAVMLDQQGRQEEAKLPLQKVLSADPLDVQARQMLIQLQLDTGRIDEARALLTEGQRLLPEQWGFTLALARLKVDSGDANGAIQLLEAGQASARDAPQYHALLAALLLRAQRYDEAAKHYLVALRSDPGNASWLVGVGVALEGIGNQADAAEAYRRADGAANLTPETAAFLSERLARLKAAERPPAPAR